MTCTQASLNTASGLINQFSDKEKLALLILFLYRQKNPATVGQTLDASALNTAAACLDCPSDGMLDSFEVAIQRQAAIDAGAAEPAFDAKSARAQVNCLVCLSEHELRAIEIGLRCSLA